MDFEWRRGATQIRLGGIGNSTVPRRDRADDSLNAGGEQGRRRRRYLARAHGERGHFGGGGGAENANMAWDRARVARTAPEHRFERRCPQRLPIDALIELVLALRLCHRIPVRQESIPLSQPGGPRAGVIGGGLKGSPKWINIRWTGATAKRPLSYGLLPLKFGGRMSALGRWTKPMGWTPPPPERHRGARLGVLSTSQRREGVHHEAYSCWGRSGKERIPGPWRRSERDSLSGAGSSRREKWIKVLLETVEPGCEIGMEACGGAHHWARRCRRRDSR